MLAVKSKQDETGMDSPSDPPFIPFYPLTFLGERVVWKELLSWTPLEEDFHRIIELSRLKKTSEIMQSNCPPITNISH